ncbi:MAG: FG-GAP-like repeat-containing protein [Planctomycetota bacterium]|jgi:tetratricopeptide (TPR) repeat protein
MTAAPNGDPPRPNRLPRRPGGRRRRLHLTIGLLAATALLVGGAGLASWWAFRPRPYRPGEDIPEITRRLARDLPAEAPAIRLTDVTEPAGLAGFRSFAGPRSSQLPEDMGGGAAWGDYDNDGDEDLLLVGAGAALDAAPSERAACRLYENRGDGRFAPVAGFPDLRIVGMAAAWGDVDGDGWLDLVITGLDRLLLLRNTGGALVADPAFPAPDGFWTGVAWGDYDGDRDLDLYVCGYVRYGRDDADRARASLQFGTAVPYTLNPSSYEPQPNLLLRNDGNGAFEDVADELEVANPAGRSLGAVWHDFDQDGWLDLYVANDVSDNVLYRNLGGTFAEISHAAWVADYRGAMGLAVGDYDRDGDDDLFVTHWVAQENALFESMLADRTAAPDTPGSAVPAAGLRFMDVASMQGLGQIALPMVGWGAEFADFDGDGWLDLAVANGSTFETDDEPPRLRPQRCFLFWSQEGVFHDLGAGSPAFAPCVGRGLAVADFDDDGDQDLLVATLGEPVRLLRNDMQTGQWIQLRLRSRDADGGHAGFADGATVVAHVGDAAMRRSVTGGSYLSQSSRTLHFGLGAATAVDRLEVRWPGGVVDAHDRLEAGALWELREGEPAPRRVRGGGPAAAGMTDRERVVAFWTAQRAATDAMKVDGDCERAVALFREALALDPDHEDARYSLANCLAVLGRTDEAMAELRRLLDVSPRSHRGLRRLGVLRAASARSVDDLEAALALLERAMAINPEETGVPLAMAEVALMLGEDDRARRHLEDVCRTNPRSHPAWYLRAFAAWRNGEPDEARSLLAEAARVRGDDFKPLGATAEGDVGRTMHAEASPLEPYWAGWNGGLDPDAAFADLAAYLREHPAAAAR